MENKKYQTVGRVSKPDRKMAERGKHDTPSTHMHDRLLLPWYRHFNETWRG